MPDSSGATVLDDLPESIIVWEILARLPPMDALRCRAVRKSWRHATTTTDFVVAHHRHQPSLAVIKQSLDTSDDPRLVVLHVAAGNKKLWPILRARFLHACRDGLLVLSKKVPRERLFYVCNPATRQCAPLPQLAEHGLQVYTTSIAGLYLHQPSQEHRLLYLCWTGLRNRSADFYIVSIGSDQPRRFLGRPPPSPTPSVQQALLKGLPYSHKIAPVLHRGGLHWDLGRYDDYYTAMCDIMVFDTVVETFRWLRRPARAPLGSQTMLLEMDGALALFSAHQGVVIDVFVMQDYEEAVWELRHRIDLSAATAELPQLDLIMVVVNKRELLIQLLGRLLHCDIDGEVLGIVECHGKEGYLHPVQMTTHSLQESMVPLAFQQGTGACNDPGFFLGH